MKLPCKCKLLTCQWSALWEKALDACKVIIEINVQTIICQFLIALITFCVVTLCRDPWLLQSPNQFSLSWYPGPESFSTIISKQFPKNPNYIISWETFSPVMRCSLFNTIVSKQFPKSPNYIRLWETFSPMLRCSIQSYQTSF